MPNNPIKGKWQPFDALQGFKSSIEGVASNRTKIPQPVLAQDQIEELNELLCNAIEKKSTLEVNYFHQGRILSYLGIVKKMDCVERKVVFSNKTIPMNSIVGVRLVDEPEEN